MSILQYNLAIKHKYKYNKSQYTNHITTLHTSIKTYINCINRYVPSTIQTICKSSPANGRVVKVPNSLPLYIVNAGMIEVLYILLLLLYTMSCVGQIENPHLQF